MRNYKNNLLKLAKLVVFILITFTTNQLYAQLEVKGVLKNEETQTALQFATVVILHPTDSTTITGGVTDEDGIFVLSAEPGTYLVKYSYISYVDKVEPLELTANTDLGAVFLLQDQEQLEAVVVEGEKSETQFYLDKKVFTVGKDLTSVGTDAIDVLGNVPSVSTDVEGNVSLRGSEGVQILINGKQSGLTGLGNTNALKNIPANLIDRIEVITNPSARYDAQGQVGIINIILKKQREAGINGSIDVNGGYPNSYGGALNLNFRQNKINLFTSLGGRYRESQGEGLAFYDYFSPINEGISFQENNRDMNRTGLGGNATLGLEYFFSEKQTLTGSFRYSKGDDDNETTIDYNDFNAGMDLIRTVQRLDNEKEDEEDLAYTINYNYDIDSLGKKISADIRYSQTEELELNDFAESILFGNSFDPVFQIASNLEMQDEYLFQIDFINPLSRDTKLEFGAKTSLRDINTDFEVQQLENGAYEVLQNQSNQFVYDENIYALYSQYGNEVGKVGYQVGLRGEYSDINTLLLSTNEENPREYFQLFPSAFLTYNTDNNNAIQLSYSRRVRRPGFWHLNPFLSFTDPRRLFSGNPNLDPELTNSYEVGYLKNWDKTTLNTALYYRKTNDVISRITLPISADTVQIIPQNLNTRDAGGLDFTLNSDITKWMTTDLNLNVFYFTEDGGNIGEQFEAEDVAWFTRLTNRFKFSDSFNGQMRFFYRGPSNTTQGTRSALSSLDLGLAKEVMKEKGTLSANVRDLFNQRRYEGEVITDNFYNYSEFQRRPRSINIGFNYRINQNNKRKRGGNGERGEDYDGGGDGEF